MDYVYRLQENEIAKAIDSPFIIAILGPRRVGKSTYLEHYIAQHPDYAWVQLNMDALFTRTRINAGQLRQIIEESVQRHINTGNKIWVTIDEVQKCPDNFEQIKMLYDEFKSFDAIKFILTGSAHLDIHKHSAESLAGRITYFHLREFSLREQLLFTDNTLPLPDMHLLDCCEDADPPNAIKAIIHANSPLRSLLETTLSNELIWGGLPEVLMLKTDGERHQYTASYIQTYLENDVRAIENITDLTLYQRILQIYAEITASLRDDSKMLHALGCARNTLIKYTSFMEATLLVKELPPFIYSTLKRITKSSKMYLMNNGMISHLTGLDQHAHLLTSGLIGHRLENWFLKELQIWNDRYPKRSSLHYWRLSSGVEVDFIVRRGAAIYPFEVTYNTKPNSKKIRNLVTFMEEQPDVAFGFYIYQGEFAFDKKNRIIFIPAWAVI